MDPASVVLSALALGFAAAAAWAGWRAIGAGAMRAKLAWTGRALALAGAAIATWFPAELYGELTVVVRSDGHDAAWLPRAIWYSLATMPLVVVPALVALRSVRAGAVLFSVAIAFQVFEGLARPFGVIFPDASSDLSAYVFSYGPPLVTTILLFLGQDGPAFSTWRSLGHPALGAPS